MGLKLTGPRLTNIQGFHQLCFKVRKQKNDRPRGGKKKKKKKDKKSRTEHEADVRFRQNNRGDYPNAKR